jgi:ketosteroid isomerase-like protein
MSTNVADSEAAATRLVERLRDATNNHDPDGVAACFTVDYRSETPAHPARSFTGRDQVRRNQEKIFTFVPDLTAELLRVTVDGDTVWTEWEHRGTRKDGSAHYMRGVIILGMRDGLACWGRFYLELVDTDTSDINAAIHRDVAGPPDS